MTAPHVGRPVTGAAAERFAAGTGRFLDDLGSGAAAAAFVRSPHGHARVLRIDLADAERVPGLIAVFTYRDLTGGAREPLPVLIPHAALHSPRTGLPLADDVVRHVGEPVVMVVAVDRYVAEDACRLVGVDYEPLPAVIGIPAARRADHLVHPGVVGNVAACMVQENGDARAAVSAAPHRLTLRLGVERSAAMPMECRGVYARPDRDDRSLRVYSATQAAASLRFALAAVLDLPADRVEVVAPDVGGGFGVKLVHPWPEEVLVPWAALRLGREVKWVEDRAEHIAAASHERGQQHEVEVGFDGDGHVQGLAVSFWHDTGAYTPYGIIVPIVTSTQLPGPYRLGAYRVEFRSLYTNTAVVTPYRGAGRPQGAFVMERTLDAIARFLGADRAEVRRRNLIRPSEMPYDQGLTFQDGRPLVYDSGDYPALLDTALTRSGWRDFATRREREPGKRLGIGIACYVEGTGMGPYEGARVQVDTSGHVTVTVGLTTQGQGHGTVFAQIAADELGVEPRDVTVVSGDTRRFPYAAGTFASRSAVVGGNAVALAAREVRAKALRVAARALGAPPDELRLADGAVVANARAIPLATVAVLANPLRYAFDHRTRQATQFALDADPDRPPLDADDAPGLDATAFFSPIRSTFSAGVHVAVVEIDPDTAEIALRDYVVVHDCGRPINPAVVEGQIRGGVAQGIGGALHERIVYGDDGRLRTGSLADLLLPTAHDVPEITIDHLVTPSPLNPLGVKGVGEGGVVPVMAAIASAIEDAEGIVLDRMPITPAELWELRQKHGG
ncbi:aerobic carbon-monoxide dehydrogenase large subunit [Saccharothrix xinjiangensis]|uniref:Aerobic carbon-monoxide dehydrogenase large subunit n=1 Tax=Saccharothrix xinjiangensis TaxID=204798 RepID=A0ABV9XXP1_9PSEU